MTDTSPAYPTRNFDWKVPIAACRMTREDVKRVHNIIDDKQIEDRDHLINTVIQRLPNETIEVFQQRRERVRDACMTTITVTGTNGDMVTGHGVTFLDSSIIPDRIISIYCDTASRFAALLNMQRPNRTSILLDFSTPPLNFFALPSGPTPNTSIYTVSAENEAWGTAVNTRLASFFSERKTRWNWLHQQGTYDPLFFVLGLPFTLWVSARMGKLLFDGRDFPPIVLTAGYVYLFFAAANLFRATFLYSRWVFPKIELAGGAPAPAHRAVLFAVLIGAIGSAVWDTAKALW